VHCLQRIDQHAGDIVARLQHFERAFTQVAQGIHVVDIALVADTGLHAVPPAVVGAAQAHQMRFAGVIARQADGLHDGFRA
jgi:hypothetical protein